MTQNYERAPNLFIDGCWVDSSMPDHLDIVDPATERPFARVARGSAEDVDRAVAAARRAFPRFAATTKLERLDLLKAFATAVEARADDLARAVSREMGAPITLAREAHVPGGFGHIDRMIDVLTHLEVDELWGTSLIAREPIGVVGMVTPWNWPLNQILAKVVPALAAGCTMVLKPSELAPINAVIIAEALEAAGLPRGVFNLVHGTGDVVGAAMATHPDIDMISFTGSTRAGVAVAIGAAPTVKRVHQELGGKSANLILDDADLEAAVRLGVAGCYLNSGQSCDAPTRMLVHHSHYARTLEIAASVANATECGDPGQPGPHLGPLANVRQFEKVRAFIGAGEKDGAKLIAGGADRPPGLDCGYYVRPTVFACPDQSRMIARDEIFGPVLAIIPYEDDADAIRIANDTSYGLAAYVVSGHLDRARGVARRLRAGNVHINYPEWDTAVPFGGYRQSGNGRENGLLGLHEFQEVKAILGYGR